MHGDTIDVGGPFYDFSHDPWRVIPVLRLVGSNWTELDTLSLAVSAMRIYQGALVIGGQRTGTNTPDIGGAYRWDGAQFLRLVTAWNTEVQAVDAFLAAVKRLLAANAA